MKRPRIPFRKTFAASAMAKRGRRAIRFALPFTLMAAIVFGASILFSQAQTVDPPRPPLPDTRPGESLSDRLDRTDGVLRPPETPPIRQVVPPNPSPDSMPVIPPPQNPSGDRPNSPN